MASARAVLPHTETAAQTHPQPHDQELLRRFITHADEAAFASLVERHSATVWDVCRRLLHHEQDAEDAFQAVFFVLARQATSIRKGEAVGSWLYGVAYRIAMKARRTDSRRHNHEAAAGQHRAPRPPGEQPWSEAACRELQRMLDDELQRLGEHYRTPFVLCCLEQMSKAEAAKELGWKEGTVSGRLARARKILQTRLARRGIVLSAVLTAGALAHSAAPALLVQSTIKSVLASLAGKAAVTISASALALAEGLMHSMTVAKVKAGICLLLALTTVVAGAGVAANLLAPNPQQSEVVAAPAMPSEPDAFMTPGVPLWTHVDEQVAVLAFSADGARLITAGGRNAKSGQLTIWDTAERKELVTLRPIPSIRAGAVSPDGATLATGEEGGVLKLRDASTGEERAAAKAHLVSVNAVAFSTDGALLATCGNDKLVKLWDANSLAERKTLAGHTDIVEAAAFFRDGRALVSGSRDGKAWIWDLSTGATQFVLSGHTGLIQAVAVSPDDKLVATASWDKTARIWDCESGKEVGVALTHEAAVFALAISPTDANLLATATASGQVYLWDLKTQQQLAKLQKHNTAAWTVCFSADGKVLASGSADGVVKLWDVSAAKETASLDTAQPPPRRPVMGVAYAPHGKTVAVATVDNTVQIRDAQTGAIQFLLKGHASVVMAVAYSPDGKTLASGSVDKTIKLWDTTSGKELRTLQGHASTVLALAFAPLPDKDRWLLASGGGDATIRFWDGTSDKELFSFKAHEGAVRGLAFAPDGKRLASCALENLPANKLANAGVIKIWSDFSANPSLTLLKGHQGVVRAVAFARGGVLASAGEDATVRIWDIDRRTESHILTGHKSAVTALAFSPGGSVLCSGGNDASIILWDPAGGHMRGVLGGHAAGLTSLAVHPQGQNLLSGAQDATVLRWPAAPTTPPPLVLEANPGGVWFAAYSPNGTWLASGGQDGNVTLWSRALAPATSPFRDRPGGFSDAALAPDGRTMALATGAAIQVGDIVSGAVKPALLMRKPVRCLAISPDGKYLAAGTGSWKQADGPHECTLWDLAAGKELATLEGHKGMILRVRFSPDGKTLATSAKDIRVWDMPSGKLRGILEGAELPSKGMVFLPDGKLATASWDRTIRFWDVKTLKEELEMWETPACLASLDVSPDGTLLVAAEDVLDGKGAARLTVWEVASGKEVFNLQGHTSRILGVAFTRDGRGVVAAGGVQNTYGEIHYWDLAEGKLRASHRTSKQLLENVVASSDGRRMLSVGDGVHLWDVDFLRQERTWQASKEFVSCGLFIRDDILATGSGDSTITLWDVASGSALATLTGHKAGVRGLALTPDGKTLISAGEDAAVKLWDLATYKETGTLQATRPVNAVAVSRDGKTLASGGGDDKMGDPGELILWDLPSGNKRQSVSDIESAVWSVSFSPDGALAAAIGNGSIKVVTQTGEVRATLPAARVRPLAFSPDGKHLVAGLASAPNKTEVGAGQLRLWDVATWRESAVLDSHELPIFSVAFAPDGRSLASASGNGTIKLWPVPGVSGSVPVAAVLPKVSLRPSARAAEIKDDKRAGAEDYQPGRRLWIGLAGALLLATVMAFGLWRQWLKKRPVVVKVATPPKRRTQIAAPAAATDQRVGVEAASAALISFPCSGCGTQLKCKVSSAGKKVRCPGCGAGVVVPSAAD